MNGEIRQGKEGWTDRGSERPVPRQDRAPEHFYEETIPSDPACAAWDEPGYQDPDLSHSHFPLGTRYWQGYAKRSTPRRPQEERAMSPEWVTKVTERGGSERPPPFSEDESDPLRERVIREKETERLSWLHYSFFPG